MENKIEFVEFRKAYDDSVLFDHLNYVILPGIYAFVGESGVGKSTLMRCIAGLEKYDGQILLNGVPLKGTTPDVHMVHQHYYSFEWLNLVDNVLMVCVGHKEKITDKIKEEAIEVLKRFGLGDHLKKIPCQISGGMDQRLSLCSVFINRWSKVVLYDEPSSGLDSGNAEILSELIKEHQAKYGTIEIVITHDEKLLEFLNPVIIKFTEEFRFGGSKEKTEKEAEVETAVEAEAGAETVVEAEAGAETVVEAEAGAETVVEAETVTDTEVK